MPVQRVVLGGIRGPLADAAVGCGAEGGQTPDRGGELGIELVVGRAVVLEPE